MNAALDLVKIDKNFVSAYIGNVWDEFCTEVPREQTELFERGLSLIFLTHPESLAGIQITELVIDERLDSNGKALCIRKIILDNLTDMLNKMGVELNYDYLELSHLNLIINIVDFFYLGPASEDAFNTILPILLASDISHEYRMVMCIGKIIHIEEEDPDLSDYECLITSVSMMTTKTLIDSISMFDGEDIPPEEIILRVKANAALFENTIAYKHIRANGNLGSPIQGYLAHFEQYLGESLSKDDTESQLRYGLDVISLFLISEVNSDKLVDGILNYLDGRIANMASMMKVEKIIKAIKLPVVENEQAGLF